MKVIEETISVLRDVDEPGLTLCMGGYRVTLTLEEARMLVSSVGGALLSDAPAAEGDGQPAASREQAAKRAAIVANVREQVISWAKIADTVQRK